MNEQCSITMSIDDVTLQFVTELAAGGMSREAFVANLDHWRSHRERPR